MGSCLCFRKCKLIGDHDDVVIAKNFESAPCRWAVINPRPSLSRLLHRQQQHQIKFVPRHDEPFEEIRQEQLRKTHSLCATLLPKPRSMTCLDVLEAYSRQSNELDSSLNFLEPKGVSSKDKSAGISLDKDNPLACISTQERPDENEPDCLEDQRTSLTCFDIFKSDSTVEVGLSDQSSLFGSLQKPPHQEKLVHCAIMQEPKTRMLSNKWGKFNISKRLSNKYWVSEQERLLQKSPTVQQYQAF